MSEPIRIAILEDHQGIIDGYRYRLGREPDMQIAAIIRFGEHLWSALDANPIDVLLLDVQVPTSESNRNPFPILFTVPRLFEKYPDLTIIVVTVAIWPAMIRGLLDAGVSAYILKDDHAAFRELGSIIRSVMQDGLYLTGAAFQIAAGELAAPVSLTQRQHEVLSLCAAYPDLKTSQLARMLGVAHSTFRNLLSSAYLQLKVSNRAAAIARAQQLGLIPPHQPGP